jgi:hypothetical protein
MDEIGMPGSIGAVGAKPAPEQDHLLAACEHVHLLVMFVAPSAYTPRVSAVFLLLHTLESGLFPVVKYGDMPRIAAFVHRT